MVNLMQLGYLEFNLNQIASFQTAVNVKNYVYTKEQHQN